MGVRAVGVNHIAFEVHDLDQALAWYERYFELTLRGRRATMAWIDLGDQFIALSEGGPEVPDRDRHVGLVVDDKEALRAALLEGGEDGRPAGLAARARPVRQPAGDRRLPRRAVLQDSRGPARDGPGGPGEDQTPPARRCAAKGIDED